MKSMLVIGAGRFGEHLTRKLAELGNEIMVVDTNEEKLQSVMKMATSVQIGDCTKKEVLEELGVSNFDVCFVCIGNNFQSSLVITDLLKEMGAQQVVSRASRDIQAKFLLKNGADEVTYPEHDIAERLAVRMSKQNIFDYIELTKEVSIFEIPTLREWVGHTLAEVNFRARYNVSILGVKQAGDITPLPASDHVFAEQEHLMVIGRNEDVERILHKVK